MFDRIVPRYDLLNRVMTLGLDSRWRAMAAAQAQVRDGDAILDVCCGTGDLTFALNDSFPSSQVTGLDFSEAMVARAREKAAGKGCEGRDQPRFVVGDVLRLPFCDGEFGAVTVAWGLRNVYDLERALDEMVRVTRPGGRVVCLDMTQSEPTFSRAVHQFWLGRAVPLLGRFLAGDAAAYAYLPASVQTFPPADELAGIMVRAGLLAVRYRRLALGGVALHVGHAPSRRS